MKKGTPKIKKFFNPKPAPGWMQAIFMGK